MSGGLSGPVSQRASLSDQNSTAAVLGVGAEFVGEWEEVLDFGSITLLMRADQVSAVDGLKFQYSSNGADVDDQDSYTVAANAGKYISVPPEGRFFRIRYLNGAVAQTEFRLQTIFRPFQPKPSSHNLRESLSEENDAELVKAILAGKKPDGTFVNAIFDDFGRLIIGPPGGASATKGFSYGEVTTNSTAYVAVHKTVYTEQSVDAQRSLLSSSAADVAAGTGARKVRIIYFDAALAGPFTEDVTLNGVTPVNTVATNICFIEKLVVTEVGISGQNAGTISLRAAAGGGGATIWSIAIGDNMTLGSQHYVPPGKTAFITSMYGGVGGNTGGVSIRAKNPLSVIAPDLLIVDQIRISIDGGSSGRNYGTPVPVAGPARITGVAKFGGIGVGELHFMSFDFYEE